MDLASRSGRRGTAAANFGWSYLISKIKGDITQLTDSERAAVEDAVAVVRRHRSARSPVSLSMPAFRTPLPSPRTESLG